MFSYSLVFSLSLVIVEGWFLVVVFCLLRNGWGKVLLTRIMIFMQVVLIE